MLANWQTTSATKRVRVPGGCELDASLSDEIGRTLLHFGVFDLVVTEALWRLMDPGETAVDAGANVGYMTAILGSRAARGGSVHSFEPHPDLFQELVSNSKRWMGQLRDVRLYPHQLALSERPGTANLMVFEAGARNRGISSISRNAVENCTVSVATVRLDDFLEMVGSVDVMKIDVEGHELAVLRGAERLLADGGVRDIIFEEHHPYPSSVTEFLHSRNYSIYRLQRRLNGPELLPADSSVPRSQWEATSFLATREPARVADRFSRPGWACLRPGSRRVVP
jgi:FkbM family methyltransferase